MPSSPDERRSGAIEHARWRVRFRTSLLDAHRATPSSGADWLKKEAELELWLKEAHEALAAMTPEESVES